MKKKENYRKSCDTELLKYRTFNGSIACRKDSRMYLCPVCLSAIPLLLTHLLKEDGGVGLDVDAGIVDENVKYIVAVSPRTL